MVTNDLRSKNGMSANTSNLTLIVEEKALAALSHIEKSRKGSGSTVPSDCYLQLANLYHFHKEYEKEEGILNRFVKLPNAANDDFVEIFDRIERVSALRKIQRENKPVQTANLHQLKLVDSEEDDRVETIDLSSHQALNQSQREGKRSLIGQTITALSVCAVYTGKTERDELIQLALVLFQYKAGESKPFNVIAEYQGNRVPRMDVNDETYRHFSMQSEDLKSNPLDIKKIAAMFEKADYVISHNDTEFERKHVCSVYPEANQSKWYSTQKDIPWKALGFETKSLSDLTRALGKAKPRTSLERAKAICALLQQEEPFAGYPFMERIYYMKPMKPITWTKALERKHKRMMRRHFGLKIAGGLILFSSILLAGLVYAGVFQ
jgi:hypothetical protein